MKNSNLTPRWAQVALACLLLLIAAGSGLLTACLNFMFGMSRHWTMAAGFVLTDATKMTLPLAARRYGWTPFIRNTFALCLCISVYAAFSCWLTESGQLLLNAGKAEEQTAAARLALAEANTKLEAITEPASPDVLAEQIDTARTRLKEQTSTAEAAGIKCAQRSKCTAAQAELAKLLDRKANAEARTNWQRQRADALAALAGTEERSLGAPDYLAAFIGADRQTMARIDNVLVTLAFIAALECLAVLSFYGAALLGEMAASPRASKPEIRAVPSEPDRSAEATLARLQSLIRKHGHLDASRSELCEQFNIRRSTLQDWISRWRDAGHICTGIAPDNRTRFTLPERQRAN